MKYIRHTLVLLLFLLGTPSMLRAQDTSTGLSTGLTADLSAHIILVTTGFTGADLLVFGSMAQPADVAIAVEGPAGRAIVRQKTRPFGIWINTDSFIFDQVPGYYSIATTRPVEKLISPSIVTANRLDLQQLQFPTRRGDATKADLFHQALLDDRSADFLYHENVDGIRVVGGHLFSARFRFPAYAPIGTYTVHVYLLRDGKVLASQIMPLSVDETGLSATIYEAAKFYPFFYACGALLMALAMGGGGAYFFHRMS